MRQSVDQFLANILDVNMRERAAHAVMIDILTSYTHARLGWYEPGRRVIADSRARIRELDRRWAAIVWC